MGSLRILGNSRIIRTLLAAILFGQDSWEKAIKAMANGWYGSTETSIYTEFPS